MPIAQLTNNNRNSLVQNTVALGVMMSLLGLDFQILEKTLTLQFQRKGQALVDENVGVARAGFDHANKNFEPFPFTLPTGPKPLAVWSGNEALAMGGAAAGVKFYCAYPMSPSTGVLHWLAANARELGIMVRQVEDEIGVANMAIGAAHAGCRAMCATSGGGFALLTEAIGMAGMMEEVLILSRLDAGKLDFQPAALDLNAFCRRVLDEMLSATNRRCRIELVMSPVSAQARADEVRQGAGAGRDGIGTVGRNV
jgi:2-oxoglutarate ferredoxin oxidoreductase subunit alpha